MSASQLEAIKQGNENCRNFLVEYLANPGSNNQIKVDSLLTALQKISTSKYSFESDIDRLYSSTADVQAIMGTMSERLNNVDEQKKVYAAKIQKYLSLSKTTKQENSKLVPLNLKIENYN